MDVLLCWLIPNGLTYGILYAITDSWSDALFVTLVLASVWAIVIGYLTGVGRSSKYP